MRNIIIICVILLIVGSCFVFFRASKKKLNGTVIVLNGPSSSGKSSIQKEFQKLCMPSLWIKVGIDNLFDSVMPEITSENMNFWQSKNPIRWVEKSKDSLEKDIVTLFVGTEGEKVVSAMNSCIASYAKNGCNVIVDYIAYEEKWLKNLETKLKKIKTYYIAVRIPIKILEKREASRGTSPKGHARSHYFTVYGNKKYDLNVNSNQNSAKEIALQIKQFIDIENCK
jgi:chloramphenicol 3-O phosphotransferase